MGRMVSEAIAKRYVGANFLIDFAKDSGMVYETIRRIAYHGEVPRNETLLKIAGHLEKKRPDQPIDRETWLRVAAVSRVPALTREIIGSETTYLDTSGSGPQPLRIPLVSDIPGSERKSGKDRQLSSIPIPVGQYGVISIKRANEERTTGSNRSLAAFIIIETVGADGMKLSQGDIVVVDAAVVPGDRDLVVMTQEGKYEVYEYMEAGESAILMPHITHNGRPPQTISKQNPPDFTGVIVGRWSVFPSSNKTRRLK